MAILVIVAICSSLALPSIGRALRKNKFKKDTQEIMARLRGIKLKAVASGKGVTVLVDGHHFNITSQGEEPRHEALTIHEEMHLNFTPEELYFSPQGWARPATILLQQDNLQQTIKLDPLSARPYRVKAGAETS